MKKKPTKKAGSKPLDLGRDIVNITHMGFVRGRFVIETAVKILAGMNSYANESDYRLKAESAAIQAKILLKVLEENHLDPGEFQPR